jgi:hypothetical protein
VFETIEHGVAGAAVNSVTDIFPVAWESTKGVIKVLNPVNVVSHLAGTNDDITTRPTTLVGVTGLSDDVAESQGFMGMLYLLAVLNVFVGVFNMFPLLPLDGGHAAIATYERVRERGTRRRYYADVSKLMPFAMAVIAVLLVCSCRVSTSTSPIRWAADMRRDAIGPPSAGPPGRSTWGRTRRRRRSHHGAVDDHHQDRRRRGHAPADLRLAAAGCDIVRCTCNETEAAEGLAQIVPRSPVPIIADIHHQYKMALAAMEAGVHGSPAQSGQHPSPRAHQGGRRRSSRSGVPIRIGVNAGSLDPSLYEKYGGATPEAMVESAQREIAYFHEVDFDLIKISVKASSVPLMVEAYRQLADATDTRCTSASPRPVRHRRGW